MKSQKNIEVEEGSLIGAGKAVFAVSIDLCCCALSDWLTKKPNKREKRSSTQISTVE
jgi:hypothetical protein